MNCKACEKPVGWLNWGGRCFGCHMYGDDRQKSKTKPVAAPVLAEKPKALAQGAYDLFSVMGVNE